MKPKRTKLDEGRPRLPVADGVAYRTRRAAVDLRRRETESERVLWEALRDRRFLGRKFRRQQAVGPFVVDFFCAAERLVVEIDGSIHDGVDQIAADESRQRVIESVGMRVVRVRSELVLNDLNAALHTIETAMKTE